MAEKNTKKNTGTIGICILYSCYQDSDPNDKPTTSILNDSSIVLFPRKTGGTSVEVTLPMTNMEVDNRQSFVKNTVSTCFELER